MKILQIIHQDPRVALGGSESYCRHLSKGLHEKKNKVAIFSAKRGDGSTELSIEQEKGINYFVVDLNSLKTSKKIFQYTNSYANPEILKAFKKVLKSFKPEIIHIHHLLTLSVDIITYCEELDIPMVATLHDYWYFCHRITLTLPDGENCDGSEGGTKCKGCGKRIYNQFPGNLLQPGQAIASVLRNKRLIAGLNQCDLIYAPCHSLMARYENEGVSLDKMRHRPYGIPILSLQKKKVEVPVVFGYIGNLTPYKGLEVLIDAAKLINGSSWKIKIFGAGTSDYETYLKQKSNGLPIEFNGKFPADTVEFALNSIDVLIVPSLWEENSPLVVHEANCCSVPVVASNIGGLSEIVSSLRGGMLFNPGDSRQLSKILSTICTKPDIIMKMKKKMKIIRPIEKEVKDMLADYRQLLKKF